MGRTNGLTLNQKKFLERWYANGGHVSSACEGIYSHRKSGYELIKRGKSGSFLNPYVQQYLDCLRDGKIIPLTASKVEAINGSDAYEADPKPKKPKPKNSKPLIKAVPDEDDFEDYNPEDANIDYLIRKMMEVLADASATANAKQGATRELRILLAERGNTGADPTKGLEILRAKMLPHARDLLPDHYQGDLDLGK